MPNAPILNFPLPGYHIRRGSTIDRAILVKFMQWTYQEIFPYQDFSHLARTVEQYFSVDTPLWWVYEEAREQGAGSRGETFSPIACLWVGNAIDQITGSRHAHIFLLYVVPAYRRRGIGTALMQYIENWAKQRGDRQIGLQVFQTNTPALSLYQQLGYQTQSLWMIKSLHRE
ncbi:GNAT family N-acetyltransferase [Sphaerospermopsis aphanizomenoides BCCUSP55]|uniref:GNAT family N-acetyltransferase n=1 Tax=Sphaerospermopsis aphanizomenoides TaxID=459663 RepID=UPI001908A9FE|nr:GNAT family N-acetyltransferase [Sphaerospermopsis aphanizomenoides]MBK1988901.1 GNAT family N-acetyltransferase [Sphaerospermopsis aphanizomenoides BCCUSP55]